jgi:hypothetical protein
MDADRIELELVYARAETANRWRRWADKASATR